MGYRFTVHADGEHLVSRMRTEPAQLFGTPYSGYLLFLAGAPDKAVLDWLRQNVISLDSLTGKDIAFGVFAREYTMRLRTNQRDTSEGVSGRTKIPLEKVKTYMSVERLVKAGECGWIRNGHELTATTYAVDEIAKQFGVLADLPCAIVLDAVPRDQIDIIHFADVDLDSLLSVLRRVIHSMHEHPQYEAFRHLQWQVFSFQQQIRNLTKDIESLRQQIEDLYSAGYEESLSATLTRLAESLRRANIHSFLRLVENSLLNEAMDADAFGRGVHVAKEMYPTLRKYNETIYRLQSYVQRYDWPLKEPWRTHVIRTCQTYALPLLPNADVFLSLESFTREQIAAIAEDLAAQQTVVVDRLLNSLVNSSSLQQLASAVIKRRRARLVAKLDRLITTSEEQQLELVTRAAELYRMNISFVSILRKAIRNTRLSMQSRALSQRALTFAGTWLNPKTVMDVFKLLLK